MERKQIEAMSYAQEDLHNAINETAAKIKDSNNVWPICDGVSDIEAYLQSSLKLMWILKEPYDEFDEDNNPQYGGYTLFEDLKEQPDVQIKPMPSTIQRVIYATYGIFTESVYDDMWHYSKPDMYKYLFQIAYINLSKIPAYTTSGDMSAKYLTWREIVLKQIDLFQPNVIILGGTSRYIKDDLGIDETQLVLSSKDWKLNIYKQNDKLYIDTYHPGVRKSPRTYVNMLVNNISLYRKTYQ